MIAAVVVAALTLAAGLARGKLNSAEPDSADRMKDFPRVILWAWERPEDLSFIDPREVGVAYLARTLHLKGERVITRPRLQPVSFPREATLIAVARIESDRSDPPKLSADQRRKAANEIADMSRNPRVAALQVDFDARVTEREFYSELLNDLRRMLPEQTRLSITALASWCIHDDWLSTLPVDEAVPMLFRMGVDDHQIRLHLDAGRDFRPPAARASLGISTDEPLKRLPGGRRVYVFRPNAWTEDAVRRVIQEVKQWQ